MYDLTKGRRLKKATFALPESLLERLRTLAEEKRISSANAAVREALEDYIVRIEREEFKEAMKKAAEDPQFIRDIEDTEEVFWEADVETAGAIPE